MGLLLPHRGTQDGNYQEHQWKRSMDTFFKDALWLMHFVAHVELLNSIKIRRFNIISILFFFIFRNKTESLNPPLGFIFGGNIWRKIVSKKR